MRMWYAPNSPYARKARVVALEKGVHDRIDWIVSLPSQPNPDLAKDNPLGKIPALVTDDGVCLYDSPVICEYLDGLHDGPRLVPTAGSERWLALRREALADGILDAVVLRMLEGRREAGKRDPKWVEYQNKKILRALDALEDEAAGFDAKVDIGTISVGCALGFLTFLYPNDDWLGPRPKLAEWCATFSSRSSMVATAPRD